MEDLFNVWKKLQCKFRHLLLQRRQPTPDPKATWGFHLTNARKKVTFPSEIRSEALNYKSVLYSWRVEPRPICFHLDRSPDNERTPAVRIIWNVRLNLLCRHMYHMFSSITLSKPHTWCRRWGESKLLRLIVKDDSNSVARLHFPLKLHPYHL